MVAAGFAELACRAHAVAHPHLYRLMNYQPLRRDLLPGGLPPQADLDEAWRAGLAAFAPSAA